MSELMILVDCHCNVHRVLLADWKAKKTTMNTYTRLGRKIADLPQFYRWKSATLRRDQVASVAVRLQKRCALDDRIERRFRNCRSVAVY